MIHWGQAAEPVTERAADGVVLAVIAGVVAVVVAVIGLIGVLTKNRGDRQTAWEARMDKRIADHFDEQDEEISGLKEDLAVLRGQLRAVGRIFRSIAGQWTAPTMPNIDPGDIAVLEDTEVLPPGWIRRSHSRTPV